MVGDTTMKRVILGVLYCILWYLSILVGFFTFICPLLPLVFFHPKLYRKWSETVFGMWEPFPVALMEIFFGIRAVLTGDQIDPFERSLLIMNHRTRLDWNFLWVGLFHCCHPYSHALKYVLKAAVMHFPGPGWVMQTCSFLFIHRNWAKDQRLLERLILYLDVSDQPYQVLLFPEGTDLTLSNVLKSHKYADEHNLERYYNVLHPKTTGFAFITHKMKSSGKINAVYDITVGYPGEAPQNETDLLKGNFPEEVHFNVKRYSACELPFSEEDLKAWLANIWKKKEISLDNFRKTGSFINSVGNKEGENKEQSGLKPLSSNEERYIQMKNNNITTNLTNNYPQISEYAKSTKGQSLNGRNSFTDMSEEKELYNGPNETEEYSFRYNVNNINHDTVACTSKSANENSNCGSDINRYRPSHLLYLTFIFWMGLIYFMIHQFLFNFYVQIWVLVHTLFFSSISLMSDGFHHIIASIYFYRNNVRENPKKRN